MVATAVILLTVFHPDLAFSRSGWEGARWKLFGKLRTVGVSHEKVSEVVGNSSG
jgi:hypothetical protein